MDSNRIDGLRHQITGTLKGVFGRLIGDAKLKSDGAAESAAGAARTSGDAPLIGIDPDRIKGVGHQIKGAFKAGLGTITNDPMLEVSGTAEREAGKAQNAAGSARDEAREAPDTKLG